MSTAVHDAITGLAQPDTNWIIQGKEPTFVPPNKLE